VHLRIWFLMMLLVVAFQPAEGGQAACPPPDVAARTLTTKQLSERVVRKVDRKRLGNPILARHRKC
jgi:hypothetical protein